MRTVVIPRADWRVKLDEFSTTHEGWRVSLELLTPEMGAQPEIADLPLRGVAAELGSRDSTITIAAGSTGLDQITHTIHTPMRVQLEQSDAGADIALEIESSDHAKAILRFTSPALPETVDGLPGRIHAKIAGILVLLITFLFAGVTLAQHRKPDDPTPQKAPPQQAQPRDDEKARPRPPGASRPEPRRPGRVVVVPEPGWPWWGYPYPYGYPPRAGFRVFADWETANVRIDVSPDDAEVYVDRFYAGVVDDFDGVFQRLTLHAGPHLIEIRRTGYISLAVELDLYPGQTVTYRRTMEPARGDNAPAPAIASAPGFEEGAVPPSIDTLPGEVKFDVTPEDAEIYADGFYAGLVDDFNGSQRLQLAPGRHHVVLKMEGYETIEVDLSIDSGSGITYRATLRRLN